MDVILRLENLDFVGVVGHLACDGAGEKKKKRTVTE
jgi:hypothetical protein